MRSLRQEKDWTLDEAGERMDLDPRYLQKVETGLLNVTFLTLVRIAHGFNVGLWALFPAPEAPRGK